MNILLSLMSLQLTLCLLFQRLLHRVIANAQPGPELVPPPHQGHTCSYVRSGVVWEASLEMKKNRQATAWGHHKYTKWMAPFLNTCGTA